MTTRRISVVLPVYNEAANIQTCLRRISAALAGVEHEILVCYDFDEDDTLPAIASMADRPAALRLVKNDIGRGAANALRSGFRAATGDVVVVTMADLSDPPEVIPAMAEHLRAGGYAVVAGSRYMKGGSQSGGPLLKRTMSRWAGLALRWIAGLGTHDATNNFRAYSRSFLDSVGIESERGFEIALELTVKAQQRGLPIGQVPTSWTDRSAGESRFRLWAWLPNYLRWWFQAMRDPLIVWGTWLGFVIGAVVFIATYASPIPFWDDLEILRLWLPTPERNWDGYWGLHNEHRIPLPRAIQVGLLFLTSDIRSGMFMQVAIQAAISGAMILVARRLRGRTSWTDVFFPLVWLHVGNCENLLMGWQVSLVLPTALVAAWMLMALTLGPHVRWARCLAMSLTLVAMPLCGGPGIAQFAALAFGNVLLAWLLLRGKLKGDRSGPSILVGGVLATAAIVFAYFQGFHYAQGEVKTTNPIAILDVATRFWSITLGNAGRIWWPWSIWGVSIVVVAAITLCARRLRGPIEARVRAGALLVAIGCTLLLGLAIGHGRGGSGYADAGFAQRYIGLPVPLVCAVYFAVQLLGGRIVSGLVRGVLVLALACAIVIEEIPAGIDYGERRRSESELLKHDILSGKSPYEVFRRHGTHTYPDSSGFCYLHGLWLSNRLHPFEDLAEETRQAWITRAFRTPISSVENGDGTVQRRLVREGFEAMLAPPRSAIRVPIPKGATRVTGMFGVMYGSWRNAKAGPLRFVVEIDGPGGPTKIFEHVLDALNKAPDRIPQQLNEALPVHEDTELVFRVFAVDEQEVHPGWGYWAAIETP